MLCKMVINILYLIYLQQNGDGINAESSYNTYDHSNFPQLEEIKGGVSLVLCYVVNTVTCVFVLFM